MKHVVHCKKETYDVYIGRPSVWGNPFVVGVDGTRSEVIRKHAEWIVTQPGLMSRIHELRGKRLGCWCSPKTCHGDILAKLANDSSLTAFFDVQ
jgi:alpha-galactosidase